MSLAIPDELHRNAPHIHAAGPENTGSALITFACERLGLVDLANSDVLDIGCGVRFTQAILNRNIPIKSYTGIDVHGPLIEYLQSHVHDPRFSFRQWDVRNERYNPTGVPLTSNTKLPVLGSFDVIWLFSVFTHFYPPDTQALLAILRHYIRPTGRLLFSIVMDDVEEFEDRLPDDPGAYPCYSEAYLREIAPDWHIGSIAPPNPEYFIQHSVVATAQHHQTELPRSQLSRPLRWIGNG